MRPEWRGPMGSWSQLRLRAECVVSLLGAPKEATYLSKTVAIAHWLHRVKAVETSAIKQGSSHCG